MNRLASPSQLRASMIRWALFVVPTVMLLGFLAGRIGGDASSPWFQSLAKPATFPPPVTFGIVWTVLYFMIGLAFALVCAAWGSRMRKWAILAFLIHFAFNLAWSPTFFGAHDMRAALGIVIAMDVTGIVATWLFFRVRKWSGWLMLPYLAWIAFATLLTWQFIEANPDGGREAESGAVQRFEL
ncbi:TspO/MBR family protein [Aurantiacibacter spongiae]|uniref:Tryptophan-rich sensory protein n=1 Tax=Aurantiacibacter spongiae TaxID=2488860 RepID=A0A3N5CP39_9SPHN|nr:TspO/MBR family protein [Aurantiacibacter spongiae]RPF70743.1 tryptophan-rich sensory protein [Aurantiacibacter spongiae]